MIEVLTAAALAALLNADGKIVDTGIASIYYPWIKSRYVPYARYPGKWRIKPTPQDLVCAHRTLPFGSILQLSWRNRKAICVVLDRGPYGGCVKTETDHKSKGCPKGYRYKVCRKKPQNGYYRGVIDASPAVHKMLKSRGWIKVQVKLITIRRDRPVLRLMQR